MNPDWTVLFVGGPGGVGKTTAARRIGRLIGTSVLEVDDLWLAMKDVISPKDQPSLHASRSQDYWRKPTAELVATQRDVARFVSSSLEPAVGTHLWRNDPVVVEGVWLTPEFMTRANYSGSVAGDRCRAVIVFEDDPGWIRKLFFARGGGLDAWPEEDQDAMATLQAEYARWLRAEALARGVPIVDARPLEGLAERVLAVV